MKHNYTIKAVVAIVLAIITLNANAQYCTSSLYSSAYYNNPAQDKAIDSVAIPEANFGNYSLGIGNTVTRYTNYSNSINLTIGKSYTLIVKAEAWSSISAWIDYNKNSVFESSEYISVTSNNSFCPIPCSVSFTVPFSSNVGLTKIRIRTTDDTFGNPNLNSATQACSTFGTGETEDYTVNLDSTLYCTAYHDYGTSTFRGSIDTVKVTGLNYLNAAPGITSNFYATYSYFPVSMGSLPQGAVDTLQVIRNTTSGNGHTTRLWIDWNNDLNFDTTEFINLSSFSYIGPYLESSTFTIVVPTSATLGLKRVRIRTAYLIDPPFILYPCGNAFEGETEDYTINVVAAPTSIAKQNTTNVTAYPNPTTGIVTLALPANETAHYQVLNNVGQVIINGNNPTIDLSAYANGTYTLRVISNTGVSTQRIVKQ
jgi:hypothetical protein